MEGEKLVPGTVQVKHRDMVTLTIESATGGTFHLHGYDIEQEVKAGEPADFYFVAEIEGRFPITFHELGEGGPGHTHGKIFQSGLLEPGDTFSYVIPEGMETMAIPFHSHLHPQVSGSLTVSHHDGATGSVDIEIKGMSVHPHETVVRPRHDHTLDQQRFGDPDGAQRPSRVERRGSRSPERGTRRSG